MYCVSGVKLCIGGYRVNDDEGVVLANNLVLVKVTTVKHISHFRTFKIRVFDYVAWYAFWKFFKHGNIMLRIQRKIASILNQYCKIVHDCFNNILGCDKTTLPPWIQVKVNEIGNKQINHVNNNIYRIRRVRNYDIIKFFCLHFLI